MFRPDPVDMAWDVSGYLPEDARIVAFTPYRLTKYVIGEGVKPIGVTENRMRADRFQVVYTTKRIWVHLEGPLLTKSLTPYWHGHWSRLEWEKKVDQPWGKETYLGRQFPDHEWAEMPEWLHALIEANIPQSLKEIWQ
jgi:hypothetical protein